MKVNYSPFGAEGQLLLHEPPCQHARLRVQRICDGRVCVCVCKIAARYLFIHVSVGQKLLVASPFLALFLERGAHTVLAREGKKNSVAQCGTRHMVAVQKPRVVCF